MPTITQDNPVTLKNIKVSNVPTHWRKKYGIQSTIVIKIGKKKTNKPLEKIYTQEEINEIAKKLPIMKISKAQAKEIAEAKKEIANGECAKMTIDELMEEVTS
jgi:hypothetical protein